MEFFVLSILISQKPCLCVSATSDSSSNILIIIYDVIYMLKFFFGTSVPIDVVVFCQSDMWKIIFFLLFSLQRYTHHPEKFSVLNLMWNILDGGRHKAILMFKAAHTRECLRISSFDRVLESEKNKLTRFYFMRNISSNSDS